MAEPTLTRNDFWSHFFSNDAPISKQFLANILVFFSICVAEFLFFTLSFNYTVIPGFVIWYFPLGFQFIIFMFLPYRYWPIAVLGICIGSGLSLRYEGSIYYEHLKHFILTLCMILHTLPIIFYARKYYINKHIFTLKSIIILVFLGMLVRLTNIGFYFISNTSVYDKVPPAEEFSIFLQHNIAAYPGVLMGVCVYLLVRWFNDKQVKIPNLTKGVILEYVLLVTIAMITMFHLHPVTQEIMKLLLLLPIIWFGYKFTWLGSVFCAIWINIVLLALLSNAEPDTLVGFQPFIVTYFLIGLVTAGLQIEDKRSRKSLEEQRAQLANTYQDLSVLKNQMQQLATDIVTTQEQEKKQLSQEIHDEIGQNITALRIAISLLEKQHKLQKEDLKHLRSMQDITENIYDNAYQLMHWLRPRIIDEQGLQDTLAGYFFSVQLQEKNIDYITAISNDVNILNDAVKIALFRTTQECVDNVLKHSCCSKCKLTISIQNSYIKLYFSDDGIGYPNATLKEKYGLGLRSIANNVIALGGSMSLENNNNGAELHVRLPI
jgi:two-component system sensor histidine kinase UhpB